MKLARNSLGLGKLITVTIANDLMNKDYKLNASK